MSILNVDKIQPIGSGSTVTVNATDTILTNAQAGVITATRFDGIISATTDDWITHQGDSNTRMGFPATDTFAVETAGSSKLRINSTGHVTIGEADFTASNDVHIKRANAGGDVAIRITNNSNQNSGTTASLYFTTSPTQDFNTAYIKAVRDGGKLNFGYHTNDPTLCMEVSTGNVGIGCENPGADPAIGNDATVLEIRQTTSGNITSGNNRKGAVLRLKHEAQWENGYQSSSPNDDLGRVEFVTGDNSTGEGVRAAIRCRNLQYFNSQDLAFEVATANSTSLEERFRIKSNGSIGVNETTPDFSGFGGNGGGIELDDVNTGFTAVKLSQSGTDLYLVAHSGAAYISTRTNKEIVIEKNSTEVAKFTDNGLKVPSGKGIDFSSTGNPTNGASTSELFDYYEEGTFTPAFGGLSSVNYSIQFGKYTRIGRQVFCTAVIDATGIDEASNITLTGLPYSSADSSDNQQRSTWLLAYGGHITGVSDATARFRSAGSSWQGVKGTASTSYLTGQQLSSSGTINITGSFSYYVS